MIAAGPYGEDFDADGGEYAQGPGGEVEEKVAEAVHDWPAPILIFCVRDSSVFSSTTLISWMPLTMRTVSIGAAPAARPST